MDKKNSEKKTSTKKKVNKKKRSIGKTILIGFLITLLIIAGAGTGVAVAVIKSAPDINTDIINNLDQSSMMYDKDEKPIERVAGGKNRIIVPLKTIPDNLQKAFVSIEDERFYSHSGIDVKRIFGALFHNLKTMSKSQGASTITQQLIKNYALSPEKKITRKLQEMYMSLQLEKKLSKDQLLEAYLNTIFLGGNVHGVEIASLHYFGKNVDKLSLAESALIAGITQNPAKYYPYSDRNIKDGTAYLDRQHTVLYKMLENGHITQEEYNTAKAEKLVFTDKKPAHTGKHQWFVEPALDQVAKDFAAKYGISKDDAKTQLSTGGFSIYLTVDSTLQEAAQTVIDNPKYYKGLSVPSKYKEYSPNEKSDKKTQPQAAAAIYDYKTGEMRAIIGGRGDHKVSSLNRATVERQPGSAIKPLSVYAPALDKKLITPSSTVSGARLSPSEAGGWNPDNSNKQYPDKLTIREALKHSYNTAAARVTIMLGTGNSMDYLKNKFHLSTLVENSDKNLPALSLGGMTNGVLATEMAAAFGVFGNSGMYSEPIMYTKVLDRAGNVILEKQSTKTINIINCIIYDS
ncbi:MAG: transglycosylase domain-containing protein [Clostridium sp.]